MTREDLKAYQALSLDEKITLTQNNIRAWYQHWKGQVYVSFSGGKDSTVLLHLARDMYPDMKAVFADTGLEYPEIRQFVKSFDNVDTVYPAEYNRKTQEYDRVNFNRIITEWGYPVIGKEVSDSIYGARRGQKSRTDKMHGRDVGSMLDLRKYLPLLEAPFMISSHIDLPETEIDSYSISAHKIHAPKGIGALYLRKGKNLAPLINGGAQERGLRAGTENVPYIAGFARAVEIATSPEAEKRMQNAAFLELWLEREISRMQQIKRNHPPDRSIGFFNIYIPGQRSDAVIQRLASRGIYVSAGSACSKGELSRTLQAMGLPEQRIASAIRITLSTYNTDEDVSALIEALKEICKQG